MKRRAEADFLKWKAQKDRKPLVLMGARQVGKTWLMVDFAHKNFEHVHVIDFRENPDYASIFMGSKDPADLLPKLSAVIGRKINIKNDVWTARGMLWKVWWDFGGKGRGMVPLSSMRRLRRFSVRRGERRPAWRTDRRRAHDDGVL